MIVAVVVAVMVVVVANSPAINSRDPEYSVLLIKQVVRVSHAQPGDSR